MYSFTLKIKDLAFDIYIFQQKGAAFETIAVGESNESAILDYIEAAERDNAWIMVENIHLAQQSFVKNLKVYLQRISRTRGTKLKYFISNVNI